VYSIKFIKSKGCFISFFLLVSIYPSPPTQDKPLTFPRKENWEIGPIKEERNKDKKEKPLGLNQEVVPCKKILYQHVLRYYILIND
jgi:hypothetical protein